MKFRFLVNLEVLNKNPASERGGRPPFARYPPPKLQFSHVNPRTQACQAACPDAHAGTQACQAAYEACQAANEACQAAHEACQAACPGAHAGTQACQAANEACQAAYEACQAALGLPGRVVSLG
jgi:hypothetical protein